MLILHGMIRLKKIPRFVFDKNQKRDVKTIKKQATRVARDVTQLSILLILIYLYKTIA